MNNSQIMFTVVTGRYDNETWNASLSYRTKRNITCIYAPPCKLSSAIHLDSPVFVIEMNNSTNQIMGIGLIKNKLVTDKVYKVQLDTNCNRYIYIGEYHLSREVLNDYNDFLVYVLEEILFKGYTHSKRGTGLTKIPDKVLKFDICKGLDIKKEIRNIFIRHYSSTFEKSGAKSVGVSL
jgi:hypothetical protein